MMFNSSIDKDSNNDDEIADQNLLNILTDSIEEYGIFFIDT